MAKGNRSTSRTKDVTAERRPVARFLCDRLKADAARLDTVFDGASSKLTGCACQELSQRRIRVFVVSLYQLIRLGRTHKGMQIAANREIVNANIANFCCHFGPLTQLRNANLNNVWIDNHILETKTFVPPLGTV